jgi:hypothetical protein
MPTQETAGCSFINKTATSINEPTVKRQDRLIEAIHVCEGMLHIKSSEHLLTLRIFDPKGHLLNISKEISTSDSYCFAIPPTLKGAFILSFENGVSSETKSFFLK